MRPCLANPIILTDGRSRTVGVQAQLVPEGRPSALSGATFLVAPRAESGFDSRAQTPPVLQIRQHGQFAGALDLWPPAKILVRACHETSVCCRRFQIRPRLVAGRSSSDRRSSRFLRSFASASPARSREGVLILEKLRPRLIWVLLVLAGWTNLASRTALVSPNDLRRCSAMPTPL